MRSNSKRTGSVVVLFLFLLPVLILVLGFSIDYAQMQRTRTELRAASDLAAKSAAIVLAETDDLGLAETIAREVALQHNVAGEPLELGVDGVTFGNSRRLPDGSWDFREGETPLNAVKVNGARVEGAPGGPVSMLFGQFYGRPDFQSDFSATAAFINADVMLVLDRSSSMKLATDSTAPFMDLTDPRLCVPPEPDSRWIALEQAVNVFLDDMDDTASDEKVGVVSFGSQDFLCNGWQTAVEVNQNLSFETSDSRTAMGLLSSQVWGGATDIAAGMAEAQNQLLYGVGQRANAIKIMVVMTDGQYTHDDPLPLAESAAANGILIYTVTFGAGANQADMIAVADAGGGRHLHADTATQLLGAFKEISGTIANLID